MPHALLYNLLLCSGNSYMQRLEFHFLRECVLKLSTGKTFLPTRHSPFAALALRAIEPINGSPESLLSVMHSCCLGASSSPLGSVYCTIPSTLCLPHLRVELSCELRALASTCTCFAGVACQLTKTKFFLEVLYSMSWLPWESSHLRLNCLRHSMYACAVATFHASPLQFGVQAAHQNFLARPPLPVCSSGFAAIELLLPVAPLLLCFRCTPRVFCALLSSLLSFASASCVELLLSSTFAALSGRPSLCLALSMPRRALC